MGLTGQLCYMPFGACFPNYFFFASVDAQWITARKDWEESKRRHKHNLRQERRFTDPPPEGEAKGEAVYDKDMDATRCILYLHGGKQLSFRGILKIKTDIRQEDTTLEA